VQPGLRVGRHLALTDFAQMTRVNSRIWLRAVGDSAVNIVVRIIVVIISCLQKN